MSAWWVFLPLAVLAVTGAVLNLPEWREMVRRHREFIVGVAREFRDDDHRSAS